MAPKKNIDPEQYKRAVEAAAKARLEASLQKAKADGTATMRVMPDSDSDSSDSDSDHESIPEPVVEKPKPATRKRGPNKPKQTQEAVVDSVPAVPAVATPVSALAKPDQVTRDYVKKKTQKIIEAELLKLGARAPVAVPAPKSVIKERLDRKVANQMFQSLFPQG